MLPSMPLISTPYKESCRSPSFEVREDTQDDVKYQSEDEGIFSMSGSSSPGSVETMPCFASGVSGCTKRCSPLKHVTPILKKYSSQRKVRGSKTHAGSPDQVVEKLGLRPIAPKPVVVMITSQPLTQDRTDLSITAGSVEKAAVVETSVSSMLPAEQAKTKEGETPTDGKQNVEEHLKTETVKDNAEDIAALMHSATNISAPPKARPALSRKKTKQLKDMEATLSVLTEVEDAATKEAKASSFAYSYFMKVKERLEGREDDVYQKFLQTMNEFEQMMFSVADLYQRVTSLLGHHSDLASEFLAFLLPEQALQCGKFMEHLMITKMREFVRKLEDSFAKKPNHMKKIYSSLSMLSNQMNVTMGDVQSTILPLLKGNTFLIDSFLELLPQECPPDSLMTEFEFVQCYDDSESDEELFETVEVPDGPDPYGGISCTCPCHISTNNEKYQTRVLHCIPCGTRFIHGRVFVETGKGLRHAKIIFPGADGKANIERLTATKVLQRKGRRRRRTCGIIKKNRSPSKQTSAANKASTEDNCAENPGVQTTSKILSPTLGRSKTRTTSVSQKARETSASVLPVRNTIVTGSPTEKKDSKSSPSRAGRQVASVRLCRVPSTVCSYAIVPSSKNNTKSSAAHVETKNKATNRANESPSSTVATTSSTTDLGILTTVLRPSVGQQKCEWKERQKKSIDGTCVSNIMSSHNSGTDKVHLLDCNLATARNEVASGEMKIITSHRKKRCMNEAEALANTDCAQVRKAARHLHDQVAGGKSDACHKSNAIAHQENMNNADVPMENFSVNVVELGVNSDTKTKEKSVEKALVETHVSNSEENESECVKQAAILCDELTHIDADECVNKMMRKDMPEDKNNKLKCQETVQNTSDEHRSKSDMKNCHHSVQSVVVFSDNCECENDDIQPEDAEEMEMFRSGVETHDESSALRKMSYNNKHDKDKEMFGIDELSKGVAEKEEGITQISRDNMNKNDLDKSKETKREYQGEMLVTHFNGEYKSKDDLKAKSEQNYDCLDVSLTVESGRYNDKDDPEIFGEVNVVETGNTENCLGDSKVIEHMDTSECRDNEEKLEKIEVSDVSIDKNFDTHEIITIEMSDKYKCGDSTGKYKDVELNSQRKCDEVLRSDEYKCEEDVNKCVVELDEHMNTEQCFDERVFDKCEEKEVVKSESCSKGKSSTSITRDSVAPETGKDKNAAAILESVQTHNREDIFATGVISSEQKCEDVAEKIAETEVVQMDLEQEFDEAVEPHPWTRDEDKVILETFQICSSMDHAVVNISHQLPSRTMEEIRTRLQTLISLLQQFTGNSVNKTTNDSCL